MADRAIVDGLDQGVEMGVVRWPGVDHSDSVLSQKVTVGSVKCERGRVIADDPGQTRDHLYALAMAGIKFGLEFW